VKTDRWRFTLANFQSQIPFGPESFALPVHVDQVFFCDAHDEPGWKLVLRKEIRGKQIFQSVGAVDDEGMFHTGRDADHEGLTPCTEVPEFDPPPMRTGRNLRREDAFGPFQEENIVFDRDVGGSGTSSSDEDKNLDS
jgi:hypothetical protein